MNTRNECERSMAKYPTSYFRAPKQEDLETMRSWRNSSRVRANSIDQHIITQEAQLRWFKSVSGDPSRRYFIYEQAGRPVGVLNFVDIGPAECSWGCHLGEEGVWPGSGLLLEIAAQDFAFGQLRVDMLRAEILEHNTGSLRLRGLFRYESAETQWRVGVGSRVHVFKAYRRTWMNSRGDILGQLPRSIGEAAKLISFESQGGTCDPP